MAQLGWTLLIDYRVGLDGLRDRETLRPPQPSDLSPILRAQHPLRAQLGAP
jgi:hypothetical protein